jgi:transcriptional regulator with XRE-family HTH domain
MSLRKDIAYFAREMKLEEGYTYEDLTSLSGMTRKQISAILNGKSGVSFDKIEEFFLEVFDTELGVVVSRKIIGNE